MEIRLDLSRHCIETAARLKLEHLIRRCLKTPDTETETLIEALTSFLSDNDFGDLRGRIDAVRKTMSGLGGDSSFPEVASDNYRPMPLPHGSVAPFSQLDIGLNSCVLSLPPGFVIS